jgi:site-specific DNA-methyltransferase (adenine-specific)
MKTTIGKATIYNMDCMTLLKETPDKFYDLALVDPPYGIKASKPTFISDKTGVTQKNGNVIQVKKPQYEHKSWDEKSPDNEYFIELQRTSKNQIIWGENFYSYYMGSGRIVWDKLNDHTDQFDCEIAYNSCNSRVDIVRYMWAGMMQGAAVSKSAKNAIIQQGNKALNEARIHPTQKPVKLYEWLLTNYAKAGDKILDTHLGSGSHAIACNNLGFELTACELDKDYYEASIKRIAQANQQVRLFA